MPDSGVWGVIVGGAIGTVGAVTTTIIGLVGRRGVSRAEAADQITDAAGHLLDRLVADNDRLDAANKRLTAENDELRRRGQEPQ